MGKIKTMNIIILNFKNTMIQVLRINIQNFIDSVSKLKKTIVLVLKRINNIY